MRAQYAPTSFEKDTLLHDRYLLAAEGRYRVYYAGLGAQPSPNARVIFVGLTPGFSQMKEAARAFTETPAHVRNDPVAYSNILRHRVAFAGTMRRNLCSMLDALGFPAAFGITESAPNTARCLGTSLHVLPRGIFQLRWPTPKDLIRPHLSTTGCCAGPESSRYFLTRLVRQIKTSRGNRCCVVLSSRRRRSFLEAPRCRPAASTP